MAAIYTQKPYTLNPRPPKVAEMTVTDETRRILVKAGLAKEGEVGAKRGNQVCVRERERQRARESARHLYLYIYIYIYICIYIYIYIYVYIYIYMY